MSRGLLQAAPSLISKHYLAASIQVEDRRYRPLQECFHSGVAALATVAAAVPLFFLMLMTVRASTGFLH